MPIGSPATVCQMVTKALEDVKITIINEIKTDHSSNVQFSICIDEWTSNTGKRYLNVTAITKSKTLNLGMVRCMGSMTSEKTLELTVRRLKDFGVPMSQVTAIISDGASVIKKLGRISKLQFEVEQQLCHAHGMHLGNKFHNLKKMVFTIQKTFFLLSTFSLLLIAGVYIFS